MEIVIVDDCSTDRSRRIAEELSNHNNEVSFIFHEKNQGKGAALRSGFRNATGDFVAIQDADLEYDPRDLKRLIEPLRNNQADVVIGSRFLSHGVHRVLYFWHSIGNKILTLLSNIFSDLNLSDMETCYKVFRREIIQSIQIEENRFGFEPEIVAKVAQLRPRVYEMGISYYGRTYEEGKKIGWRDGLRALYCIFHYNMPKAPIPIQLLTYLCIGGVCALFNVIFFQILFLAGFSVKMSASVAFVSAAILNYFLCITFLFRHKAMWNAPKELFFYALVVFTVGVIDVLTTHILFLAGYSAWFSKSIASVAGVFFNFIGRRFLVFSEKRPKGWKQQLHSLE